MDEQPWWQQLFGEDYLRAWGPVLPPERTEREVEGILRLLDLPSGSRILDLCCGHGRHAVALAGRGYQVTGQDLSEPFLRGAREAAAARGVAVAWVHGDMRRIPFEDEFDAVLNLFTAFGYFDREEENQQVLEQVAKALRPGGVFLLDFINRERVVREHRPHIISRHDDGLIVLDEGEIDLLAGRTERRVTLLFPGGARREYRHSVRIYTLVELVRMLASAGLELTGYWGDLDGGEFGLGSQRLVIQARRAARK